MYDLFDPFVTHCPNGEVVKRMGGVVGDPYDDGGKYLCMDLLRKEEEKKKTPCTIFSLGSNGDFSFEESMLTVTDCDIHTFDCTISGASIHPRHQYHQRCLGSSAKAALDERFITLSSAAAELGVEKINLLKIDVEGYEFDALATWTQFDTLPEQVAIELHHSEVRKKERKKEEFLFLVATAIFSFTLTCVDFRLFTREQASTKLMIFRICYVSLFVLFIWGK